MLAQRPGDEQTALRALWADIEALRKKTEGKAGGGK